MIRNTGAWLEKALVATHQAYHMQQVATLEKVEPPVRVIHGPPKRIIMLKNPFLDFVGAWTAHGGRCIHMEAKSTTSDRLPILAASGHGISDTQLAALLAWHEAGACVGVLWGYLDTVRFVSLKLINARLHNGHKSVLWGHAEPVHSGMGFVLHDWLVNLRAEYGLGGPL